MSRTSALTDVQDVRCNVQETHQCTCVSTSLIVVAKHRMQQLKGGRVHVGSQFQGAQSTTVRKGVVEGQPGGRRLRWKLLHILTGVEGREWDWEQGQATNHRPGASHSLCCSLEPPRTPPTTRDQEFQHKRLANINHIGTKHPLPDWFPWSVGRHILVAL